MNRQFALRVVLALVCISHLVLGAIGYFASPGPVTKTLAAFYGASVTLTPQSLHLIRILGAFMIAIGVLAGFAFRHPRANRTVIYGVIVLLLLRVSQRLLFAREIHASFNVSYGQLWTQSIFFFALAVALFLLRPRGEGVTGA